MEVTSSDGEKLDRWHRDELERLGFSRHQERYLRTLIDRGDLDLAEIREKVEGRGWGPDQVMACYAA